MENVGIIQKKTFHYKKLAVPARMRSIYWKYFGFPAGDDGKLLTKEKIVCLLCKTQMIYNRNTSNLRMHLISKHKNTIQEIEPSINTTVTQYKLKKEKSETTTDVRMVRDSDSLPGTSNLESKKDIGSRNVQVVVSDVGDSDISNIAIIFPNEEISDFHGGKREDHVESADVTDAVVNFLITDLVPPRIIEGKGFQDLLSHLSGRKVCLPNEQKLISENLQDIHNTCKEQLFSMITSNCITNIALSIEEWKCVDNVSCLSIYMHYLQNGEPCLFTKLLTTIFCTGTETAQYWGYVINKLCVEWSINLNAITAVLVSFSNKSLEIVLKESGLILLPCFIFVIQELCSKHVFTHPNVSRILSKCQAIVKVVHDLKIDVTEDTCQEIEEDENDPPMAIDQPDLWLTTYYMLRGVLRRKDNITQILLGLDYISNDCFLHSTEWQCIYDILMLLEPLKTIIITLLEEKNALISLLKPLMWQVNTSKFDINSNDSEFIKNLKNEIKYNLNEIYSDENIDNLIQVATMLDPRFKGFCNQDETCSSECSLTDLLTHLVKSEGSLSPCNFSNGEKTTIKKSSRSSINVIFGDICANKPALTLEDKVKVEVSHYENETSALLEECPLEWWQHMRAKCPNLSRLALRYHCVPAIVMWYDGSRTFREYVAFYRRRSLFKANVIDSALFLHSNKFNF